MAQSMDERHFFPQSDSPRSDDQLPNMNWTLQLQSLLASLPPTALMSILQMRNKILLEQSHSPRAQTPLISQNNNLTAPLILPPSSLNSHQHEFASIDQLSDSCQTTNYSSKSSSPHQVLLGSRYQSAESSNDSCSHSERNIQFDSTKISEILDYNDFDPDNHQRFSKRQRTFLHANQETNEKGQLIVDGVNLDEIKEFSRNFKMKRISLGLTQTQVGISLTSSEGPAYSQSAICRFEKLDITPKSAQRIKPVLERWLKEAETKMLSQTTDASDALSNDSCRKRKRRTSFNPAALDYLNEFFERNPHPSGTEMHLIANHLNYEKEVIRVWFCNKRQALKNTMKRFSNTGCKSISD